MISAQNILNSDIMIGFLLGILGTLLFEGVKSIVSPVFIKKIGVLTISPLLTVKLFFPTKERAIYKTIKSLFESWETGDEDKYLSRWHKNATKVIGDPDSKPLNINEIRMAFLNSLKKYKTAKVTHLLVENINFYPDYAVATIAYRFELIRERDLLPVIEEAQEIYRLSKDAKGLWKVIGNYDHFKVV